MWPSWVFGIFGPRNRFPRINGPKGAQKEPKIIKMKPCRFWEKVNVCTELMASVGNGMLKGDSKNCLKRPLISK